MDMTRPSSGHDQTEDPIKIHHPEEVEVEEHHESGASKMFKKVKARAKKFKNSLTKHGHDKEEAHVLEEEDDDDEEDEESSAVNTNQLESLSHPRETNLPTLDETKPVLSSDHNTKVESEPLREEARHHVPMNSHVTEKTEEEVTRKFAPDEDEYLGGQREVNTDSPRRLEDDQSGESNYQPKFTHKVENFDSESEIRKDSPVGFGGESVPEPEKDFPARSFEFDQKNESEISKDSPKGFGGESEAEQSGDFPAKSHELDQEIESGIGKDSPTRFNREPETTAEEVLPAKSHKLDQEESETTPVEDFPAKPHESTIGKDSPTGFGGESRDVFSAKTHEIESGIGMDSQMGLIDEPRTQEHLPAKSYEFEQTVEIGTGIDGDKPGTEKREDFLGKSYEFDHEIESGIGKDSPTRLPEDTPVAEEVPAKESHVYEETRDETTEPKPITYTEKIGSATTFVTDKAIATKNVVASSLGYSGEQSESPVGVETPITATGVVGEKLSSEDENVEEIGLLETAKLPLSGGGSGAEETEQEEGKSASGRDYLAEKLKPGEEDKALSEMITEKLQLGGGEEKKITKDVEVAPEKIPSDKISEEVDQGEADVEEDKGGVGMVGKIKGVYNYWMGGTTEEVLPKSPVSVEETSQSLGSTLETKGFPDSSESGLGETGGSTGDVPVQKGV